jgi:NAD(P)-dependent dehydrogenase (short-subunit alcohol dehydrogenase family)
MIKPEDIRLADQVAIVTGGASGIGGGIARGMASCGAHIVIADVDAEKAEENAKRVRALGREAMVVMCDVTKADAVNAMVEAVAARFGRIDILVNNVGGSRLAKFMDLNERRRQRHIGINLDSFIHCTYAVVPRMIAGKRGGSIINITSIEGLRAAPSLSVYGACKWAMVGFTQSMALELAEHRIRVNAIAPDICPTEGVEALAPGFVAPASVAVRSRYIPLGHDATPDDMAGPAVFLASKFASYVTGVCLSVDGGTKAASGWVRTERGDWTVWER